MSDPLRDRIRSLFDNAVSDAPTAPTLADIESARRDHTPVRSVRRWAVPATIGLAAATILAFLVLPNRSTESIRTADTSVTDAPTLPRVTSTLPPVSPTVASTPVDAPASPPSTVDQTVVVIASAGGVSATSIDGPQVDLFDGGFLTAHGTSDDRIVALRSPAASGNTTGTIVMWDPRTGTVDPVDPPNPTGGELWLHDVATVNGRVTILYEYGPTVCDAVADDCDEKLATFEPDTGNTTELLALNGARNSWKTLSLADTGLIVGEIVGDDGTTFHSSLSGLDASAVLPDPDDLGLATSPAGCSICPTGFVVDRSGRHIGWIQGPDIVIVDLDDLARRVLVRSVVPEVAVGLAELDIDDVAVTEDGTATGVASVTWSDDRGGFTTQIVDLGSASETNRLDGSASLG